MSQTRRQLHVAEREARELFFEAIQAGASGGWPILDHALRSYAPAIVKTSKAELLFNIGNGILSYFLCQHAEVFDDYRDDETSDPGPVCISFVRVQVAIDEQRKQIEVGALALEEWHSMSGGEPETLFVSQQEEWAGLAAANAVQRWEFSERLAWFRTESRRRGQRTFLDAIT